MKHKKNIGLRLYFVLLLALLVAIVLSSCGRNYMSPERALRDFSNRIERGNLDGLTLTIYYRDILTTFHFPFSVEDFVGRGMYERKIVVDGTELEEYIELLRQVDADSLMPVTQEFPMLVMLYYVFEVNGRKIFSFVPRFSDDDSNMLINGIEFEWKDAFIDVIRPFLPKDSPWLWD